MANDCSLVSILGSSLKDLDVYPGLNQCNLHEGK